MMKFLLGLFLLFSSTAWAAYPNYTVKPSGGDFATLQGAVNDLITNHATPSTPVTITISGSWSSADTTSVNITSGLTTTSSNTLTISTTGSSVNNGQLPSGSGGYWLKPSSGDAITVSAGYVTISGLAFDMSTSGGNGIIMASNYPPGVSANGNYFKLTTGTGILFSYWGANASSYLYNNVCIGNQAGSYNECIQLTSGNSSNTVNWYIYNNTCYGLGRCFDGDASANGTNSVYLSNNFAGNTVNESIYRVNYQVVGGSNNVCSDSSSCTTAPLTSGTNNATSYTSYFTSPGSSDFSLKAGSILIGGGTSESGTFTTDITGATRSTWDVGAFYYATAPVIIPITTLKGNGTVIKGNGTIIK